MGELERIRQLRVGGAAEVVDRWRDSSNEETQLVCHLVVRCVYATAPVDVALAASGNKLVQD